jgi:hypothetical protein
VKPLPRSIDDIAGLRVARWIRESTAGQYDRYGPDSQRDQQDRFIERHDLVDTGLVFQVAHSGTTVWKSPVMRQMTDAAQAGEFDLLLAGYSDRWQRNLRRTLEVLEDDLHPAGAALVMCDRRILSSDTKDWDELIAESVAAERYSRRLGERITDGYGAKFERHNDQGGLPPLGFSRSVDSPHTLEIDPGSIGDAVELFQRYALGTVSYKQLAGETGFREMRIQKILQNPIYNGWMRRHRGVNEERLPASWRSDPPVDDELFATVQRVRRSRSRGGGPRQLGHVDLLSGLLECSCGRRIRSDGKFSDGRRRKRHPDPCSEWGPQERYGNEVYEAPVLAQASAMRVDDVSIARVVSMLGATERPVLLDKKRVERELHALASDAAEGRIDDNAYLSQVRELRRQLDAYDEPQAGQVSANRAAAWLSALGETLASADAIEARSDLIHAIYEKIIVAGPRFVSARLTPAAYAYGLAALLPEVAMASPAGAGTTYAVSLRILGRRDWLSVARSA